MAEPEFTATGVRIRLRLRCLTNAGQILLREGRLMLLTSSGREIDGAPVHLVRAHRPWFGARGRALATLNGKRYALTLGDREPTPGETGPPSARTFLEAVRTAGGRAAPR